MTDPIVPNDPDDVEDVPTAGSEETTGAGLVEPDAVDLPLMEDDDDDGTLVLRDEIHDDDDGDDALPVEPHVERPSNPDT